jgi:hypothetical protein
MEVEPLRMWVGGEVFERNIVRGNEIGHVVSRKGRTRARRVGAGADAGADAGVLLGVLPCTYIHTYIHSCMLEIARTRSCSIQNWRQLRLLAAHKVTKEIVTIGA